MANHATHGSFTRILSGLPNFRHTSTAVFLAYIHYCHLEEVIRQVHLLDEALYSRSPYARVERCMTRTFPGCSALKVLDIRLHDRYCVQIHQRTKVGPTQRQTAQLLYASSKRHNIRQKWEAIGVQNNLCHALDHLPVFLVWIWPFE